MPGSTYSLLFPSGNPETQTHSSGEPESSSIPASPSGGSGSSFALLFGGESNAQSPLNGQSSSAPTTSSDDPWYKKAWNWANTPLTTSLLGLPEDRQGAGGFERGVEHIVSGLTSPLSLALTAATFGTGGFIESAGSTALKEALTSTGERAFTDAEIESITKGSQVALQAAKDQKAVEPVVQSALEAGGHDLKLLDRAREVFGPVSKDANLADKEVQMSLSKVGLTPKQAEEWEAGKLSDAERSEIAGANKGFTDPELDDLAKTGETVSTALKGITPVEDALKAAGVDPALYKRGLDFLHDNGLTAPTHLLGGDLLDRGAFQILRKALPTIPVAATARAALTAKSVMNAGFTLQQLQMAAQMSPRFFDALKEGDYDHALEYGTEAVAGAGLGVLGASHALHSAGELFEPLLAPKPKLNDQFLTMDRFNKEREATHAVAEQHEIDIYKTALSKAGLELFPGPTGWSDAQKAVRQDTFDRIQMGLHTGGDLTKAQALYDALKRAVGEPELSANPLTGQEGGGSVPPASKVNTRVVHSNDAGEVRVGADNRPVAWINPEHWKEFEDAANEGKISGVSHSPSEADAVASRLPADSPVRELLDKARSASAQDLLTTVKTPGAGVRGPESYIRVLAEEVHHTWQRELSQDGEIANHLDPEQWQRLHDIIPKEVHNSLDEFGYPRDPVVRVAETFAKFLSDQGDEYGAKPDEVANFLDQYYKEVKTKHGQNALDTLKGIGETAKQHVEDIYANQEAARTKLAESRQNSGKLPSVGEGGQRGPSEVAGREQGQKGLASRELTPKEEKEFGKLSGLRLRVGMGDPGSAGLVTGGGKVLIGRDHAELAREAGYKATPSEDLYAKLFNDGGVRVRSGGGVIHFDFMKSDPKTLERVRQSVLSSPDAGKYYVEFRRPEGGTGFSTSAYDKEALLQKLKDWGEGRTPSATPAVNSVAYFRNLGLASRERENRAPQWYLKSNQLIDSRMQGPMPADVVKKMLENNGVKPDELKYTGLDEFLKSKGKEPVRPEEVREFLAANNLQVQEVTKGFAPMSVDELMELDYLSRLDPARMSPKDGQRYRELTKKQFSGGEPKFGTYTLAGGQNYREMLLTLPENGSPRIRTQGQYTVYNENGQAFRQGLLPMGPEAAAAVAQHPEWRVEEGTVQNPNDVRRDTDNFHSPHYDELNVVGHVRFNDRTGPNGEKLLHLEELQSDWHQKGRTQGYAVNSEDIPLKATKQPDGYWEVRRGDTDRFVTNVINPDVTEAQAIQEARRRLREEPQSVRQSVPDAPFKKTWPELLMKRTIRYASENGYDGISWTPGEEQAARYDLSKQIGRVKLAPGEAGPGKYRLTAYDHSGNFVHDDTYTENQLPDVIGKEAAHKLLEETPDRFGIRQLSGLNIKVGGEGMKGFYDKMVPEMANKLGKQFGAKVGETKIKTGPQYDLKDFDPSEASIQHRGAQYQIWAPNLESGTLQFKESFDSEASAKQFLKEYQKPNPKTKTVPYFPITESMRESVLRQGQPLFARESPVNGLPDNIEDLIQNNVFKDMPKEYRNRMFGALEDIIHGRITPKVQDATDYLRNEDSQNYTLGSAYNLIHHFTADHMHRMYEDDNPAGRVVTSQAKQGKFATNVTQARQQVYDSFATALLKSPKKIKFDPAGIISQDRAGIIKAAANRQFIDNLRDKFTVGSDGRPVVVMSGAGNIVAGENGEDPRTLVYPERIRKLQIADKAVEAMRQSGDLDRFLQDGTVKDLTPKVNKGNIGAAIDRLEEQGISKEAQYDEEGNNILRKNLQMLKDVRDGNRPWSDLKEYNDNQKPIYAFDPQDYISLNQGAFKDWNFITNDTSGNKVMVRADMRVHPEFADYLKNRLGLEPSAISNNPIGKALLGAGTKLKHTLLSMSPFHMAQEALRAIMVGVNPFGTTAPDILTGERINPSDPNSPTILKKMVENRLILGTDLKSLQEHSEGLSAGGSLLRMIPGVGKTLANSMDWYQDLLFKRYIPALKARGAELMFKEYKSAHPEWSDDRIARVAAEHTNRTFGGINWQAMGRSATTQDWGRLMLLAPDWLESEMSSGAALFNKEEGGLSRMQVAKMAFGLWGIARVLNLVTTGNAHQEAPFGLAVKNKEGKETVFSIRTLPTDLLHAASDPSQFLIGRLSPVLKTGEEIVSGRDSYGRKLGPQDLWSDVFHQMMPIPFQSVGQALSGTGPEVGNVGQVWKAGGGTAQTYSTPAQHLAADLAASHSEDGVIDPSQMARHRRIIQFEDQARAGELSWPELMKMTFSTDQLKESELKQIQNNVKKTQGMDPSMASLYTRASRLPAKEYLDLLNVANPAEKAALAPLTIQVQKKYLTKAKKDMTPEERQRDPVFQKLLNMIPGQTQSSPQPQSYVAPQTYSAPQPQASALPPAISAPIQKEVAHLYAATHPVTGHKIGSNDGQNWFDRQTGEPVNG